MGTNRQGIRKGFSIKGQGKSFYKGQNNDGGYLKSMLTMNNSVSFYRCWRWRWWRRRRREGGLRPATALDRRTTEEKTVCELDSCPEHDDGGACHSIAYFILNTIQKRNILHIMKNDRMCCICTRFYRHEHRRPLSSGFVRLGHHHRPPPSIVLCVPLMMNDL